MSDAVTKIIEALLSKDPTGLVSVLLLVTGYLGWRLHLDTKGAKAEHDAADLLHHNAIAELNKQHAEALADLEASHKQEIHEYKETIHCLQDALNSKTGEERRALIDIIERYHQSQMSTAQAMNEIRGILTISMHGRSLS